MNASRIIRRSLFGTLTFLAIVVILTAGLLVAIDAGLGQGLLIRGFAWRTGRSIEVRGSLTAHLLSASPRIEAELVRIGNPPWMPPGTTAELAKVTLVLKPPGFLHPPGIVALDAQGATLYLVREPDGRANWQVRDPARPPVDKNSPILRTLRMPNAHVLLQDAKRHLGFDGTVTALDLEQEGVPQPLRIEGAGQLNGRAVTFELTGDPLASASHKAPYRFAFSERSSGSRVDGKGMLPRPFRFDMVDATFRTSGPDLKDLFFLTGVHLIDTGEYQLSGAVSRRGLQTRFNELVVASGGSDVHGSIAVDSSSGRPQLDVDLHSRVLKLADLGVRAAGRATEPKPPLLISDARLSTKALDTGWATVRFAADRLEVGRVPLERVSARATLDQRVLTVEPFIATAYEGRISARLTIDGTHGVPVAKIDLNVRDLQLGKLSRKDPAQPPAEGPLAVHLEVTGRGVSAHQIAGTANGTLNLSISGGAVRKSLAELTGIDLRGLGMLLVGDKKDIPIRCAQARFRAKDGTLVAQNLVLDTDRVLITGTGQVNLDSEVLDLTIGGHPKRLRLFRVRAPLLLSGTLAHPSVHVEAANASLVLVDPGRAKDVDCAQLLASEN